MADPTKLLSTEVLALLKRHNLLLPLLQGIVSDELTAGIALTPEKQAEILAQWQGQQDLDVLLEQAQAGSGLSRADVECQLQRPVKMALVARERFLAKAENRFIKRKTDLDLVSYSLIRVSDFSLARELYLRVVAGEATFAQLAFQYSDGPEKHSQGQIGPRPLSEAHPLLAERLRTARDGDVMEPFQVASWWLIVRRDQLISAMFDDEMAERMARESLQEWLQEEAHRRIAGLIADSPSS